jgi:hypothetical protein
MIRRICLILLTLSLLAGCTSLLIGNRMQSALIGALFEQFLGFNPNDAKLFDNPIVKGRMQAMLGNKYEPTLKLLREAQAIQRDGAVFYVLGKALPAADKALNGDKAGTGALGIASQLLQGPKDPAALAEAGGQAVLDNAGMSFNPEKNQFTVMLIEQGKPQIFQETLNEQGKPEATGQSLKSDLTQAAIESLPGDMKAVFQVASALKGATAH